VIQLGEVKGRPVHSRGLDSSSRKGGTRSVVEVVAWL
jgi:hypothetical protein